MAAYYQPDHHVHKLLSFSTDFTSVTALDVPSKYYGLTVYQDQLVMVGGEVGPQQCTNNIWTSDKGANWRLSLPPMPTKCRSPRAVGTSECLVVAGGTVHSRQQLSVGSVTTALTKSSVYVQVGGEWHTLSSLPRAFHAYSCITIHNGNLCINRSGGTGLCCKLSVLLEALRSGADSKDANSELWRSFNSWANICSMASFEGHLFALHFTRGCSVVRSRGLACVFSPFTNRWSHVVDTPQSLYLGAATLLSSGGRELVLVGECRKSAPESSLIVYKASIKST